MLFWHDCRLLAEAVLLGRAINLGRAVMLNSSDSASVIIFNIVFSIIDSATLPNSDSLQEKRTKIKYQISYLQTETNEMYI